eukprot:gene24385-26167_t
MMRALRLHTGRHLFVMIIVYRKNGERTVISGWRAWLITALASLLAAIVLVSVLSLVLGIAITVAGFLITIIPIVIIVGLVINWLQPKD